MRGEGEGKGWERREEVGGGGASSLPNPSQSYIVYLGIPLLGIPLVGTPYVIYPYKYYHQFSGRAGGWATLQKLVCCVERLYLNFRNDMRPDSDRRNILSGPFAKHCNTTSNFDGFRFLVCCLLMIHIHIYTYIYIYTNTCIYIYMYIF